MPSTHRKPTNVSLDPDNLLHHDIRAKFTSPLDEYDHIFDPNIKGYNGAEGPFEARINMGPLEPPQRKCRINIPIEYLNPSSLIKKPSGATA